MVLHEKSLRTVMIIGLSHFNVTITVSMLYPASVGDLETALIPFFGKVYIENVRVNSLSLNTCTNNYIVLNLLILTMDVVLILIKDFWLQ